MKKILIAVIILVTILCLTGCRNPCQRLISQRRDQAYNGDYGAIQQTDSMIVKLCKCDCK